jgi:hypothetical protein
MKARQDAGAEPSRYESFTDPARNPEDRGRAGAWQRSALRHGNQHDLRPRNCAKIAAWFPSKRSMRASISGAPV